MFSYNTKRFIQITTLYGFAVVIALFIWSRNWEIIRLGSVKQTEDLFGIFSFIVFCVITLMAYIEIKQYKILSIKNLMLIGLPYFVSLILLEHFTEFETQSFDYRQYEDAFRAVAEGNNPYLGNRYLYPPVFADMMVLVYRIGLRVFPLFDIGKSEWIFVFYTHQCVSFFFLLLSYFLSLEFAKQIGLKKLWRVMLVSAIYLFNVPILRTISFNQVNFYILVSILLVLILLKKYPFMAGLFATLGGLIKLYPFALSIPMLLIKKWRTLAGMLIGFLVVIFIQTDSFRDFELWRQFYEFYLSFPFEQESTLFRNSSPMSFLRSSFSFLGLPSQFVDTSFTLVVILVLVWFAIRFYQRQTIVIAQDILLMDSESFRITGHLLDFSVISLLIAPSAWEHHYVIAIPLVIWAFALRIKDAPMQMILGFILVFALPIFNIYPFSYLRLIGIILLLILTSPENIKRAFASLEYSLKSTSN